MTDNIIMRLSKVFTNAKFDNLPYNYKLSYPSPSSSTSFGTN